MSATVKTTRWREEYTFLVVAGGLAALAGLGGWFVAAASHSHGTPPDRPRELAGFTLTDRSGRTVTRADLDGKFLVVNFVFTGCSITCLDVNRRMAEIQTLTARQPDVKLVSLTVDPRTDTPQVLAEFGNRFGADTNRWLLLTGDKPVLYDLIEKSFIPRDPDDPYNFMPGGFTHTERIAVMDTHGRLRAFFDGMKPETSQAVTDEINQLRASADSL
ncbi:MAG: SCO family protein [Verrucomicrobiales bacterium]|nr:SCO family protein [Verrucomicrobiales bacterium]